MKLKHHDLFPFRVSLCITSKIQVSNDILGRGKLKLDQKLMMNLCVKTIGSRSSHLNAGVHNCDSKQDLIPTPGMKLFCGFMSSNHHLFVCYWPASYAEPKWVWGR